NGPRFDEYGSAVGALDPEWRRPASGATRGWGALRALRTCTSDNADQQEHLTRGCHRERSRVHTVYPTTRPELRKVPTIAPLGSGFGLHDRRMSLLGTGHQPPD